MASKRLFLEEDFSCPICCSVFSNPVLLLCGHSGCKECIENYWRVKKLKECPLCRKVSITKPPPNLALRNLCHAFLDYQKQLEELCEVHHEKLSLFCDDDEQLVCERCRDFGEHKYHTFRPICEVAEENKVHKLEKDERHAKFSHLTAGKYMNQADQLMKKAIHEKSEHVVQPFLNMFEKQKQIQLETQQTFQKTGMQQTQVQYQQDPHQKQTLQNTLKRLKYTPQDPVVSPGELIDHAKYIGNLKFNVLSKIRKSIGHSPVVLDPNTINCQLQMSDNLTEVWNPNVFLEPNECWAIVPLPTNLERFENYPCVVGSNQCKEKEPLGCLVISGPLDSKAKLCVRSPLKSRVHLSGYEKPNQVRVNLDMSEGQVSFSDPQSPVVLDPNTVNCQLLLSDDLTEVWNPNEAVDEIENLTIVLRSQNLDRFNNYSCVLGTVGFSTGTHSWDVEVAKNNVWLVGVATESVQRRGKYGRPSDIWTIGFKSDTLSVRSPQESCIHLSGYEKPKQVWVKVDMSEGQVSFSDPQSDVVFYTFTHNF
ncbi:nuclear factor 7, ovary-like [Triplophysa rosa]|uniref:nuclear factor 7, ovary-like n=1 Tax=Triplophysa rosa TaxID=992332 RepID=UPI0025463590|nr:nuclear factor 7, ovary-like [Triplophysa rosa]